VAIRESPRGAPPVSGALMKVGAWTPPPGIAPVRGTRKMMAGLAPPSEPIEIVD